MADRIETFHVTETGGDTPGQFTLYRTSFNPGFVTAIVIHAPGGHTGNTGIQVAYSQQQIIPSPPRVYWRGNKRTRRWELSELFPAEGDWWIQVFNAGRYDHSWEIEFEVEARQTGGEKLLPVILYPYLGGVATDEFGAPVVLLPPDGGGGGPIIPV